jgi:hypothetical protein
MVDRNAGVAPDKRIEYRISPNRAVNLANAG